jgi:5-methylcytosine-specific restriction enzyme A
MNDPRYNTKRWRELKARAVARDGKRCAVPGCQTDRTQPHMIHGDHIVEARDGGDFWDLNNIQVLCQIHHRAKTLDARAKRGAPEPVSPNS